MPNDPQSTDPEPVWSRYLAGLWPHGQAEWRTADGCRVDVLTSEVAWEVEWAKKWKEAPGQALWYSIVTGRQGGVCLLLRDKPSEKVYVARCAAVCRVAGLQFTTWDTRKNTGPACRD